jgi:hypothetical protein
MNLIYFIKIFYWYFYEIMVSDVCKETFIVSNAYGCK